MRNNVLYSFKSNNQAQKPEETVLKDQEKKNQEISIYFPTQIWTKSIPDQQMDVRKFERHTHHNCDLFH